MVTLLSKIFIKNPEEYRNDKVRRSYGVLCGILGIFLNVLLCTVKFTAGVLSGSIAVTADAFNNLSDAASSAVTMIGFKMAGSEPDSEHPFGHGRIEYISGLVVSIIIILMAWELLRESIDRIMHPSDVIFDKVVIIILVISIFVKVYMALYNFRIGKLIDSAAMKATGIDSSSDAVVTTLVLVFGIVLRLTNIRLDGYGGLIVALFVFWAGIRAIKETVSPLLGKAPDPEVITTIYEIVMSDEHKELGIVGMHDLIVHDYGPGRVIISLDVEVSCNGDSMELHNIIDDIENDISERFNCYVTIHMDPVLVDDPETDRMKAIVESIITSMDEGLTFHDFRLSGDDRGTKLYFDVVIPYGYHMKDDEVKEHITRELKKINPGYECVIYTDKV